MPLLSCASDVQGQGQGGGGQQQHVQQQLGLAHSMMCDVVRADMVELHRLGDQVDELRAWLSSGSQPADMGYAV